MKPKEKRRSYEYVDAVKRILYSAIPWKMKRTLIALSDGNRMAYNAIRGVKGRLFDYSKEARMLEILVATAKPKRANVPDVQVRDFRRTFSTRLENLGTPHLVRKRLLGHSVGLDANYVPEHEPDFRKRMVQAVDRLVSEYGNSVSTEAVNS